MSDISWEVDDKPFATRSTHGLDLATVEHGFALSGADGFMLPTEPHGIVIADHRMLSHFEMTVDGIAPRLSASEAIDRRTHRFVFDAATCGHDEVELTVLRVLETQEHGEFGDFGGVEARAIYDIEVASPGERATSFEIRFRVDADFLDVMKVRDPSRVTTFPYVERIVDDNVLRFVCDAPRRSTTVTAGPGARVVGSEILFACSLLPGERADRHITIVFEGSGAKVAAVTDRVHGERHGGLSEPPRISSSNPDLDVWCNRAIDDFELLTLHGGVLAAGLPWFQAPFARDACIAILLAGPFVDQRSVRGTLELLARHQGVRFDARTNEEPGRIPHEIRLISGSSLSLRDGTANYFSIDSTPLWLLALCESMRGGALDAESADRLRPNVDAAIRWIETKLKEGGLVRYRRAGEVGLVNQGWKDSLDCIVFADGRPAGGEIALLEVQCYAERALRSVIDVFPDVADRVAPLAGALRAAINQRYWAEDDRGRYLGIALDGDDRVVDEVASNAAHGLWTESFDPTTADAVTEQLTRTDMWTEWGVRTLAAKAPGFDIDSDIAYHRGPVWPHETALLAHGWQRYGRQDLARMAVRANLHASTQLPGHRLPEVHSGGIDQHHRSLKVLPRSCILQLWATAAAPSAIRVLSGLDIDARAREIRLEPSLPDWLAWLSVSDLQIAGEPLSFAIEDDVVRLEHAPDGYTLNTSHR